MMKRSAEVFNTTLDFTDSLNTTGVSSPTKLRQRMHLHEDLSVSVTCYDNNSKKKNFNDNSNNNCNTSKNDSSSLAVRCRPTSTSTPTTLFLDGRDSKIVWSSTVQIRPDKMEVQNTTRTSTTSATNTTEASKTLSISSQPIELIISSSVPPISSSASLSSSAPHHHRRLVQNHSKLSVPVLKSIFQKSIRRKKPIPSIKVGAELMDKSFGDFIRRLPIIILEDSTYHPKFPFLIWLLMASSKEYVPTFRIKKYILTIIYEVASCRYQDLPQRLPSLSSTHGNNENNNNNNNNMNCTGNTNTRRHPKHPLTLSYLHNKCIARGCTQITDDDFCTGTTTGVTMQHNDELIVWAILVRAKYGGMNGDIKMLHRFAHSWYDRFFLYDYTNPSNFITFHQLKQQLLLSNTNTNKDTDANNITNDSNDEQNLLVEGWKYVPTYVHKSASKQSMERINQRFDNNNNYSAATTTSSCNSYGLPSSTGFLFSCLTKSDVTREGIDFHVSNILDKVFLNNNEFVQELCCNNNELFSLQKHNTFSSSVSPSSASPLSPNQQQQHRRSLLEGVLKHCMWKYSAGVNHRIPLISNNDNKHDNNYHNKNGRDNDDSHTGNSMKQFYISCILPRTTIFSERYIQERLSWSSSSTTTFHKR